jgi:hypothetical protein
LGIKFAVVGASQFGVAQSFMRGIQFLRARNCRWRIRIQVGMKLLGEQPVGGADLRERAAAVEAERGVMIRDGCLQRQNLADNKSVRQPASRRLTRAALRRITKSDMIKNASIRMNLAAIVWLHPGLG